MPKAFKLMKLAGATGAAIQTMKCFSACAGTAGRNEKDLKAHLHRLEEAEKRDHRKLGHELDAYVQEEGRGMVFWHKKGLTLWHAVENYVRRRLDAKTMKVRTPQVLDRKFWEQSGHWDKYREICSSLKRSRTRRSR